jgi:hypothetical protein
VIEDELHRAVAEVADAVEEHDRGFGARGHPWR